MRTDAQKTLYEVYLDNYLIRITTSHEKAKEVQERNARLNPSSVVEIRSRKLTLDESDRYTTPSPFESLGHALLVLLGAILFVILALAASQN